MCFILERHTFLIMGKLETGSGVSGGVIRFRSNSKNGGKTQKRPPGPPDPPGTPKTGPPPPASLSKTD